MYLIAAALISLLAGMVTLQNWRAGLYFILLAGFLQDPFRKLTPGIPSYYLLWSATLFGVVILTAWVRGQIPKVHYLSLGDHRVRTYGRWLLFLIGLQALHSLVRWGNPLLPAVGMIFYLAPVAGLLVGIAFARDERQIRRFMIAYLVVIIPAALSVYLSSIYQDSYPVLQEIGSFVGAQLRIYDVGTVLDSYSGLFRVGEIAAWHGAMAAMFLVILSVNRPSLALRIFAAIVVVALMGAIVLTGRRKMLMVSVIFIVAFAGGLAIIRRGAGRLVITSIGVGLVGLYGYTLLSEGGESSLYLIRSATVFGDSGGRFGAAIDMLLSAIDRSSGIGMGIGVATQGAQYVGEIGNQAGGAGESGLGKIALELGVPGLVLLILLLFSIGRRVYQLARVFARRYPESAYYSVAFIAVLLANVAAFAVASQLFGDPFILILLGLVGGMLFRVLLEGKLRLLKSLSPDSTSAIGNARRMDASIPSR